jgi:hypothetical protein
MTESGCTHSHPSSYKPGHRKVIEKGMFVRFRARERPKTLQIFLQDRYSFLISASSNSLCRCKLMIPNVMSELKRWNSTCANKSAGNPANKAPIATDSLLHLAGTEEGLWVQLKKNGVWSTRSH